jgi:hypothetical protein
MGSLGWLSGLAGRAAFAAPSSLPFTSAFAAFSFAFVLLSFRWVVAAEGVEVCR